jgi:hypothetical protein
MNANGRKQTFPELAKTARALFPEMYDRPVVVRTHTVAVRDSANYVTYELLSDHGTVDAKVNASTWGWFKPSLDAVMAAFQLLVPGDHLEIRWVPCPMGDRPHTHMVRVAIDDWLTADETRRLTKAHGGGQ